MNRFYLVKRGSKSHKLIEEMYAKRDKGMKERWKFVYREFPESKRKKSGYQIAYWQSAFGGEGEWAVKIPADETGTRRCPDNWKFRRRSFDAIVPKVSTERGKELAKEMKDEKYSVPGATEFGIMLGIKPTFFGMEIRSPSFRPTNDGRYILELCGDMKSPLDAKRISDIEVEKLTRTKAAKARAKKR